MELPQSIEVDVENVTRVLQSSEVDSHDLLAGLLLAFQMLGSGSDGYDKTKKYVFSRAKE